MITRPDYLRITDVQTGAGCVLGVECHIDDYRFIIGRKGRAIQSLQTLFRVIGGNDKLVKISVSEPPGMRNEATVIPPISWERDDEMGELLVKILDRCSFAKSTVLAQSAGNQTILSITAKKHLPEELKEAIEVIFRAMGRMNGRYVELDVR